MTDTNLLWTPSHERVTHSQLHAFMTEAADEHGFPADYASFHQWSVSNRDTFWRKMFELAEIQTAGEVGAATSGDGMLSTKWFPEVRLSFAQHLLRFSDDRIAISFEDELGRQRTLSYGQLRGAVGGLASAMRDAGIQQGDRVAGFLPNIPEAVIAMLAAASLGAVWSSCSPDFGINGVFDRFGQIEPKILFATDGYSYNGKRIDCLERVRGIVEKIPSIKQLIITPFLDEQADISSVPSAALWGDFTHDDCEPTFEMLPFDHPLYIMYSSGTTGIPKCIVHGAGGTLLQHMKELMLHCDLRREDKIFYFTTCGWMMWNWLVSSLGVGATVVLYEGAPFHPDADHLWRMVEQQGISVFGTSPRFISACEHAELHPGKQHNLDCLRAVLSTGSPLTIENFRWVYENVKGDLQLSSISGGTDIISCFMLGNPILPVHAGEIQSVGLGMDVQSWDANGKPVIGEKGELVCCSPFPSQPVGFWNDDSGEKYRSAYFDTYPGIWRHGDFVELTPCGGVIVHGRSDATLNPGGVRIGTAEIYRQVESLPEIVDSVVVGKRTSDADIDICLFLVLEEGLKLDDDLTLRIKQRIAEGATKRHVPKFVRQVTAVPYTISGKKVELAVAQMIHGETVLNRDALANPSALDQYADII